jgi:hypothetical protein
MDLSLSLWASKVCFYTSNWSITSVLIPSKVPPESLSQIAGTEEPCISLSASCWIAEIDTNATHIYENQKEPTLTCADQDSMRDPEQYVISHTDNYDIAQQLLALMLQSVASGRSFPYNHLYSSYANPEKEAIGAAYRFWGRGITSDPEILSLSIALSPCSPPVARY